MSDVVNEAAEAMCVRLGHRWGPLCADCRAAAETLERAGLLRRKRRRCSWRFGLEGPLIDRQCLLKDGHDGEHDFPNRKKPVRP